MRTVVVLEGDQTGQELLEESLRALDVSVTGVPLRLERFDLSLESRRRTANGITRDAATAMRGAGLGIKAATITPETKASPGSTLPSPSTGVRRSRLSTPFCRLMQQPPRESSGLIARPASSVS